MTTDQPSPWTVSVISTQYDLGPGRLALRRKLTGMGFRVMAFEAPDFPVEPHVYSHDACLVALQQSDAVVLEAVLKVTS